MCIFSEQDSRIKIPGGRPQRSKMSILHIVCEIILRLVFWKGRLKITRNTPGISIYPVKMMLTQK